MSGMFESFQQSVNPNYEPKKADKSVSYEKINKYISLLKDYEAPEDSFAFFVIGAMLGISGSLIHKHLTTQGSRQLMWLKMRNVWAKNIKEIKESKSKWTRFKNRIRKVLGGKTKKYYDGYFYHLKECINFLLIFYKCLFENGVITSSQIELIRNSDQNVPISLSQLPENLFGGQFQKEKIGTIGTLLYLINLDYSSGGNIKKGIFDCEASFIKAGEQIVLIKFFLTQLSEHRATKKIDKIFSIYKTVARTMGIQEQITMSKEPALGDLKRYLKEYPDDLKNFLQSELHINLTSAIKRDHNIQTIHTVNRDSN